MAGNPGCGSLTRSPLSRARLRCGVIKALRLPVKRTSNYLFIYTIKACSAHLHAGVSVLIRYMNSRDALPISFCAMRRSHARALPHRASNVTSAGMNCSRIAVNIRIPLGRIQLARLSAKYRPYAEPLANFSRAHAN